jgi:hypothetical protein
MEPTSCYTSGAHSFKVAARILKTFALLFDAIFDVKKSRLKRSAYGKVKCPHTERLFTEDFSLASMRLTDILHTNYPYSLSVITFLLICYLLHTGIFNRNWDHNSGYNYVLYF